MLGDKENGVREQERCGMLGETVLKVVVPDSYDPTTAGLPCSARKSK